VLVDGRVAATWTFTQPDPEAAALRITPLRSLDRRERDAVTEEGERLVVFLGGGGAVRSRVEIE
jgi:hypothetical protein